jgi:hypothetical protein
MEEEKQHEKENANRDKASKRLLALPGDRKWQKGIYYR